ncbi:hypothetical protein ACFPTO_13515 [Paraburkholderia denitrificans]|uniref:Uncharacterized protein n=1 Tax=Paraburkholderia denitrificans TaxID=694025 RepID=A0ABW0J9P5_9BURK
MTALLILQISNPCRRSRAQPMPVGADVLGALNGSSGGLIF